MTIAMWLASLAGLAIGGLIGLIWFGNITASDARDLFLVIGLPIVVLLSLVVGAVIQRYVHENERRP